MNNITYYVVTAVVIATVVFFVHQIGMGFADALEASLIIGR